MQKETGQSEGVLRQEVAGLRTPTEKAKDWLTFQWSKFTCLRKGHELFAIVRYTPLCAHLIVSCQCCGLELGHFHIPYPTKKPDKGQLH